MTQIPSEAKRVFQGVIFDIYHWDQEQFDGSIATWECIKRQSYVGAIVTNGEQILVVDQEQPGRSQYPCIPAGRLEENENPQEGMLRELEEETGYQADTISLFKKYEGYPKVVQEQYIFIASVSGEPKQQNLDVGERISPKWITFDEFLQLCRNPLFAIPSHFKMYMYEALLDKDTYNELKDAIFTGHHS